MKLRITIIFLLFANILTSQTVVVSGYIFNNKNKETLPGAVIINKSTNETTSTNDFGYYSLKIPSNTEIELEIRYIGFKTTQIKIMTNNNIEKNIYLEEGIELEAVYVTSSHLKDLSIFELSSKQIKLIPSLAGEKDILKAFQFMPGVQFGSEGTSNLIVRGGSPDQNMIMLDDVPLYYVNHLGSFVSVFDVNAIKNVKLYKGEFPAKYGGRLSSVVNIKLKDGDMNKHQSEINIGLISTKLSLNGPIIKDKMSYLFTIRRCNIDLATRILDQINSTGSQGGYTFYDVNFKLTYKLSKNNNLQLFAYNGRDKHYVIMSDSDKDPTLTNSNQKFYGKINNRWGNNAAGLKWTHKFNKAFSLFNIGVTNYYYQTQRYAETTKKESGDLIETGISNFSNQVTSYFAKENLDFYISNSTNLNIGSYLYKHNFNPGNLFYEYEEINVNKITIENNQKELNPLETGAYIELSQKMLNKINVSAGMHFSAFFTNDTMFYSYQPRLKTNIEISDDLNLKFAYSKGMQYIHLLTMSTSLVPADIWVPATKKALPSKVDLFSTGFSKKINSNKFLFGFDIFYKKLNDLIDLIPFAEVEDNFDDEDWQTQIATNGKGNIYGCEIMLSKNTGKTTGWIAYTLMKNTRNYNKINDGKDFPYFYDRRHYFTLLANHEFNNKITVSANFVLATGTPITISTQKQNIENTIYATSVYNTTNYKYFYNFYFNDKEVNYTGLNNYRLPVYHRLDISIDFKKQTKKYFRTWSISIYNVYNRQNPYFLYFERDKYNKLKLYKFTLFPIIPSVSYSLKF